MKHVLFGAAALFWVAGVSAQQPAVPAPGAPPPAQQPPSDNPGPSMGERTGTNSLLKVTPSTEEFVRDAATSDMFEIAESRLAAAQGSANTKIFANRMLKDHQQTTNQLTSLLQSGNVGASPPGDLDAMHQRRLEKLKDAKGSDFDKLYGQDQIATHDEAVSLFERYAKSGDNPALKEWAGKTLPTLKAHQKMAGSLSH